MIEVLNLGKSPLANSLKKNKNSKVSYFPLSTSYCLSCMFMQVNVEVKSSKIFPEDYDYQSGTSNTWLKHCKSSSIQHIEEFKLNANSLILEVASNDGSLLNFFQRKKIKCIGVDPSNNLCEISRKKGINVICDFLNLNVSKKIKQKFGIPKLIIANNVLAHVPNITDFIKSIKSLMDDETVLIIEFPHLLNLIKLSQFDTIYHEHYSYFSLNSVNRFFFKSGLNLFKFQKISTHGGSLRIYLTKDFKKQSKDIAKEINEEKKMGLNKEETLESFKNNVKKIKNDFINFLKLNNKKKILGFGAAAKATTLLNYCNLDDRYIPIVCDNNSNKIGKYIPGCNALITNPKILEKEDFDFIIIFPWNIRNEIIKNIRKIYKKKIHFVTVIPELKIE